MVKLLNLALESQLDDFWLIIIIVIFVFSIVIPTIMIWTRIEDKIKAAKKKDQEEGSLWA